MPWPYPKPHGVQRHTGFQLPPFPRNLRPPGSMIGEQGSAQKRSFTLTIFLTDH